MYPHYVLKTQPHLLSGRAQSDAGVDADVPLPDGFTIFTAEPITFVASNPAAAAKWIQVLMAELELQPIPAELGHFSPGADFFLFGCRGRMFGYLPPANRKNVTCPVSVRQGGRHLRPGIGQRYGPDVGLELDEFGREIGSTDHSYGGIIGDVDWNLLPLSDLDSPQFRSRATEIVNVPVVVYFEGPVLVRHHFLGVRKWQPRWAVLCGPEIHIYGDPDVSASKKKKGKQFSMLIFTSMSQDQLWDYPLVTLDGFQAFIGQIKYCSDNPYRFTAVSTHAFKSVEFAVPSRAELCSWMRAFKLVSTRASVWWNRMNELDEAVDEGLDSDRTADSVVTEDGDGEYVDDDDGDDDEDSIEARESVVLGQPARPTRRRHDLRHRRRSKNAASLADDNASIRMLARLCAPFPWIEDEDREMIEKGERRRSVRDEDVEIPDELWSEIASLDGAGEGEERDHFVASVPVHADPDPGSASGRLPGRVDMPEMVPPSMPVRVPPPVPMSIPPSMQMSVPPSVPVTNLARSRPAAPDSDHSHSSTGASGTGRRSGASIRNNVVEFLTRARSRRLGSGSKHAEAGGASSSAAAAGLAGASSHQPRLY